MYQWRKHFLYETLVSLSSFLLDLKEYTSNFFKNDYMYKMEKVLSAVSETKTNIKNLGRTQRIRSCKIKKTNQKT